MIIILGFTQSDHDSGYSSFSDGYRPDARQDRVTIALEGAGTAYTAEQWAEAAFIASNHPGDAPTGPARALQLALADQPTEGLRSLSVGDTVTVFGQLIACTASGWQPVNEPGDAAMSAPDRPDPPPGAGAGTDR